MKKLLTAAVILVLSGILLLFMIAACLPSPHIPAKYPGTSWVSNDGRLYIEIADYYTSDFDSDGGADRLFSIDEQSGNVVAYTIGFRGNCGFAFEESETGRSQPAWSNKSGDDEHYTVSLDSGAIAYQNGRTVTFYKVGKFSLSEYESFVQNEPSDKVFGVLQYPYEAVGKAKQLWTERYGSTVVKNISYRVFFDDENDCWLVKGTIKRLIFEDKTYYMIIQKSDGKVLAEWSLDHL